MVAKITKAGGGVGGAGKKLGLRLPIILIRYYLIVLWNEEISDYEFKFPIIWLFTF